jgi:hypothetical protein
MKTLTLRKLPPPLTRAIENRARREHTSLTRAALHFLEESTGIAAPKKKPVAHHDLDWFFGRWTQEEADEFDRNLREQRRIDPEIWR